MNESCERGSCEAWIVTEESLRGFWESMTAGMQVGETKISAVCAGKTMRQYRCLEELFDDRNEKEREIECLYIEVVQASPRKECVKVTLHKHGLPPSRTMIVKVHNLDGPAFVRCDQIWEELQELKAWWHTISLGGPVWRATMTACISILSTLAILALILVAEDGEDVIRTYGISALATGLLTVLLGGLMRMTMRTLFPQGTVAIGKGKLRAKQTARKRKVFIWFIGTTVPALLATFVTLMLQ